MRNRTPLALELTASPSPAANENVCLHKVIYRERDQFERPWEKWEQRTEASPFHYDCLALSLEEQRLQVGLEWERSDGAPRRPAFPRPEFALLPGQWLRVTYNLRTSGEDVWFYHKRVLNIGLFESACSRRVFLESEPTYTYENLAQLW
ncbi:hypothetical protein [Ktedonobacter racemifer]|nr:hypothetical protein [Ktedonobacter racemifer]